MIVFKDRLKEKKRGIPGRILLLPVLLFVFSPLHLFSQHRDTIYIRFDDTWEEMRKADFTREIQAGSPDEKLKRSLVYYIEQMEPPCGYANEFSFSHVNRAKKTYKEWDLEPPIILHKAKSFLRDKKVLDINFFRTTPYPEIAKTFEEEDSWAQDVLIFMVDADEVKNDSLVLREVTFGRPVKE